MVFKSFETGSGGSGNRISKRISSKKNSLKKGFTLVELIVVLVVLAILAAITVPALVGFVGKAKQKQYIAEGKEALTASQSVITDAFTDGYKYLPVKFRKSAFNTSGVEDGTSFIVWTSALFSDGDGTYKTMKSYTIVKALYKAKDGSYVFYNGSEWDSVDKSNNNIVAMLEKADQSNIKNELKTTGNYIMMWPVDSVIANGDSASGYYDVAQGEEPANEEDREVAEEKADNNGSPEDTTESGRPAFSGSIKVILKAEGARTGDPYIATFSNGRSDFQTIYDSNTGFESTPSISEGFNTEYYKNNENVRWTPVGVDGHDDLKSISDIDAFLAYYSLGKDKDSDSITFMLSADEQTIDVPVSFLAFNNSTQKVTVNSSDDYEVSDTFGNDEVNDTLVVTYGKVSHKVESTYRNAFSNMSNVVKVESLSEELDTVSFAGWAMQEGDSYHEVSSGETFTGSEYAKYSDGSSIVSAIEERIHYVLENESSTSENLQVVFKAPADINKTAYIRGTMKSENVPDKKVEFVPKNDETDGESGESSGEGGSEDESEGAKETVFAFDTTFSVNELVNKIVDENDTLVSFEGENPYSIFDSEGYEIKYDEALKLKSWYLYESNKTGTDKATDFESYSRELDCSELIVDTLINSTHYGEIAELDVSAETTMFKKDNKGTKTRLNQLISSIANGRKILSVNYATQSDYHSSYSSIDGEVCLSTTEVKTDGAGGLEKDPDTKEYVVLPNDRDPLYPAYTVAYSTPNGAGCDIHILTEEDTNIYATGSLKQMFNGFDSMTTSNIMTNVNSADVKDMSQIFDGCKVLTSDITLHIDNVETMEKAFYGCTVLPKVSLIGAGQEPDNNLDNTSNIFTGCSALNELNINDIKFAKLTSLNNLFSNTKATLENVSLNKVTTTKISSFKQLFGDSSNTNTKLKNVTIKDCSFEYTSVISFEGMFRKCTGLEKADFEGTSIESVNNMSYMFSGCTSLKSESVKKIYPQRSAGVNCSYMFQGCTGLTGTVEFKLTYATNISFLFKDCNSISKIVLTGDGYGEDSPGCLLNDTGNNYTDVLNIGQKNGSYVSLDLEIKNISFPNFQTKQDTMSGLHYIIRSSQNNLASCKMDGVYLPNLQTASFLFQKDINKQDKGFAKLTKIEFLNIYAPQLFRFKGMAQFSQNLTTARFRNFNIKESGVNFSLIFRGCSNLTTVDFGSYGTDGAFTGSCIDDCNELFAACSSLEVIDLSAWNNHTATSAKLLFAGCTSLKKIYVSDYASTGYGFDLSSDKAATNHATDGEPYLTPNACRYNGMFGGCSQLTGGNGTTIVGSDYNKNNCNKFARPDKEGAPGLFTVKE